MRAFQAINYKHGHHRVRQDTPQIKNKCWSLSPEGNERQKSQQGSNSSGSKNYANLVNVIYFASILSRRINNAIVIRSIDGIRKFSAPKTARHIILTIKPVILE